MGKFFRRPSGAPGQVRPTGPGKGAMAAARALLTALAREWRGAGVDPRDPVTEAMLRPMLEAKLAESGQLAAWRAAGIDPYAVIRAAFDALDAEEPA